MAMNQSDGKVLAWIVLVCCAIWLVLSGMQPAPKPDPVNEAASRRWATQQLDPDGLIQGQLLRECMATPGCDPTGKRP